MPDSAPIEPLLGDAGDQRPILVTGATGFIGLEVARQLAHAGVPTRAMFRRAHRAALLGTLDIELVNADLRSPASLQRAVAGCRAVIHCAGRATFEPYERLRSTLVDGTAALAALAAEADVERFVFASSLFVHGPDDGPEIDRASPTNPAIGYGVAKLEAEAAAAVAGLPKGSIAVRLPHVYGWNDLMFGILRTGWLPFAGDPDRSMAHLHIEDAAAALISAVESTATSPVPLGDDRTVDWATFLEVIKTYQPTARIVPVPSGLATPVADVLGSVIGRGRYSSMVHGDTIRGWTLDLQVPPGSLATFGLECRYPSVHRGIPAVLDAAMPYRWRHPVFDRRGL